MTRPLATTLAAALILLTGGCASLVPVGSVLESMEPDDVDVVIGKTSDLV